MNNLPPIYPLGYDFLIFTDGSCAQQIGGAGIVIINSQGHIVTEALEIETYPCTNNIAELEAMKQALSKTYPHSCCIYTDSKYVQNSLTQWIHRWITTGFKDIKNVDLMKRCYDLMKNRQIEIKHVRAHQQSNNPLEIYNNYADQLANEARLRQASKRPSSKIGSQPPRDQAQK